MTDEFEIVYILNGVEYSDLQDELEIGPVVQ